MLQVELPSLYGTIAKSVIDLLFFFFPYILVREVGWVVKEKIIKGQMKES